MKSVFYFCNRAGYIDDKLSNLKVCIMRIPSPEGSESLQWPSLLIMFAKYVSLLHSVLRDELDSSTWRCPFFLVFRVIHWQNHRTVI